MSHQTKTCFNPLDRVKFVQMLGALKGLQKIITEMFQSPRSGQICSNKIKDELSFIQNHVCFNPLDRVKFVQILYMPKGGMER